MRFYILILITLTNAYAEESKTPVIPSMPAAPTIPSVPSIPSFPGKPIQNNNDKDIKQDLPSSIPAEVQVPNINVTLPADTKEPEVIIESTVPKNDEPNLSNDPNAKQIDTVGRGFDEKTSKEVMPEIAPEDKPVKAQDIKPLEIPPVQSTLKAKKAKKKNEEASDNMFKGLLPKTKPKKETKVQISPEQASDIVKEKNLENGEETEKVFNLNYKNKTLPKKFFFDPKSVENQHLGKPVSTKDHIFASFIAIQNDDIEGLRTYSEDIGHLNFTDDDGNSPLMYAIIYNSKNIFDWIIANKDVEINKPNVYGATPLHAAIISGNINFTKSLLSKKVDVNALDKNGKSALDYLDDLDKSKQDKIKSLLKKYKYKAKNIK